MSDKTDNSISNNIPRSEYPRPSFLRGEESWLNLNGVWQYEEDPSDSGWGRFVWREGEFPKNITVPFVPESKLSGIENQDFMKRVWYRREFSLTEEQVSGRVLINFGAVDYEAWVIVNGKLVGNHCGGYTPFSFDITEVVKEGVNTVVVTAMDDTRDMRQPSGKQSRDYDNFGCHYTRCTGIWQTVWIEFVPKTYVKTALFTPEVYDECVRVRVKVAGDNIEKGEKTTLKTVVSKDGDFVSEKEITFYGDEAVFSLLVKDPVLWDIGKPELYDVVLTLGDDIVTSYFGMRDVKISGKKFLLNGRPVFQKLVLDQGYYPDGIYTAPSDDDIRRDIELSMEMGFNGARMHMKIFEPGYIYHADHMGYLLWGEYPCWGLDCFNAAAEIMLPEWIEAVQRDFNSPAIIGWCPFNEAGTDNAATKKLFRLAYNATKLIDPSRPVIDASGWYHAETDIYDVHDYEQNPDVFRSHYTALVGGEGDIFVNFPDGNMPYDGKKPYFVSEFGGAFYDSENPEEGWGYGENPKDEKEFMERFDGLLTALIENPAVCGFCYTQFYDVMQEKNGLYTYDRRPKFDIEKIKAIVTKPAAIEKE